MIDASISARTADFRADNPPCPEISEAPESPAFGYSIKPFTNTNNGTSLRHYIAQPCSSLMKKSIVMGGAFILSSLLTNPVSGHVITNGDITNSTTSSPNTPVHTDPPALQAVYALASFALVFLGLFCLYICNKRDERWR